MNIILDRFPEHRINLCKDYFIGFGYDIKLMSIMGQSGIINTSSKPEIYGDFDIASGVTSENVEWQLDSALIQQLSLHEGLFITVLSRFVILPGRWTVQDMSDHYLKICNFWLGKIQKYKIKACLSYYTPHEPSSFALYILTKILQIPYIFIDVSHVARKIRFISCSFSERTLLIRQVRDSSMPGWAHDIIEDYIYNLQHNFQAAQPLFMKHFQAITSKPHNVSREIKNIIKTIIKKISAGKLLSDALPPSPLFFKIDNNSSWLEKRDTFKMRIQWLMAKALARYRIWRLETTYNNLVENKSCTSFTGKYIYFPLPLEPEGSTIPTALSNRSVTVALHRILSAMPDNCRLIVKANPVQFNYFTAYYSTWPAWHGPDFYDEFRSKGNVIFASYNHDSCDLIDHSIGVICINGTAAIEAAARGKYAIIFSPMWYDSTPGICLVETEDHLRNALNLMEIGVPPKPKAEHFPMEKSVLFDQGEFIDNDFEDKIIPNVCKSLLRGLEVFDHLDERKWSI